MDRVHQHSGGLADIDLEPCVGGCRVEHGPAARCGVLRDDDDLLPAEQVRGTIRAIAPTTLVAVQEFDRYQGSGVPDGRVSLSLRLTFRGADRTLTDHEVQQAIDAVITALAREHQATLRGK